MNGTHVHLRMSIQNQMYIVLFFSIYIQNMYIIMVVFFSFHIIYVLLMCSTEIRIHFFASHLILLEVWMRGFLIVVKKLHRAYYFRQGMKREKDECSYQWRKSFC